MHYYVIKMEESWGKYNKLPPPQPAMEINLLYRKLQHIYKCFPRGGVVTLVLVSFFRRFWLRGLCIFGVFFPPSDFLCCAAGGIFTPNFLILDRYDVAAMATKCFFNLTEL